MQTGLLSSIGEWIKRPFDTEGSAFNWVLFVGLLVIAAWLWSTVLRQIRTV